MGKKLKLNQTLNEKTNLFIERISSEMYFQSDYSSDSLEFDWINEIEKSCPYIDNIVTNPKVALIKEEDIVKIEKAKKVSVASIKDLSKHTEYIDKIDPVTDEVQPSKLLIERSEETFNTYENRFVFTLIYNLSRFIMQKEKELEDVQIKDEKVLEYAATTNNGNERINIELKITSNELPDSDDENKDSKSAEEKIEEIKERISEINKFLIGWQRSELYTSLNKANVAKVTSPIKRTNVILKNPNFQNAIKLWDFLQSYIDHKDDTSKDGLDSAGDEILRGILDDAFLMDYFVIDSISRLKRRQKKQITDYAIIMMHQQIKRVVSMLISSGKTVTDKEILDIIIAELKKERDKTQIDSTEVRDKFKNAISEYLDKAEI